MKVLEAASENHGGARAPGPSAAGPGPHALGRRLRVVLALVPVASSCGESGDPMPEEQIEADGESESDAGPSCEELGRAFAEQTCPQGTTPYSVVGPPPETASVDSYRVETEFGPGFFIPRDERPQQLAVNVHQAEGCFFGCILLDPCALSTSAFRGDACFSYPDAQVACARCEAEASLTRDACVEFLSDCFAGGGSDED